MIRPLIAILLILLPAAAHAAHAACRPGVYGVGGDLVVLGAPAAGADVQRWLYLDGRRGTTGAESAVRCAGDVVSAGGRHLSRQATIETDTRFASHETRLAGQLIEPPGPPDPRRPLVVMVHGSEKSPAIGFVYGYALAAQGISVFVYDKRGTGASEGSYSQNFELLADDASAAFAEARRLAAGRFGRAGYFGGSQGGWVAPLAATRSPADFVAVGFGLVASPIDEDRDQLIDDARAAGLDAQATEQVRRLSAATAAIVTSHFGRGFEALEALRREIGDAPWAARVDGEYSGAMLRMSDADLRRIGRALFDDVGLIWDYDAVAALRRLDAPLLWVLAGEDREAPIAQTRAALLGLAREGRPIDLWLFPGTDHGMVEYRIAPDGARVPTRITDGYLRLLGDWIRGAVRGAYGRGELLHAGAPAPAAAGAY